MAESQTDGETILAALDTEEWRYGLDTQRRTKLRPTRFYAALAALESAGRVEAQWDGQPDHHRMYRRAEAGR